MEQDALTVAKDAKIAGELHGTPGEVHCNKLTVDLPARGKIVEFIPALRKPHETLENSEGLLSPADRARRARIYEICFGAGGSPVARVTLENAVTFASFTPDMSTYSDEDAEHLLAGLGSTSNPFLFPQKPIEQKELLNEEVEIVHRSRKKAEIWPEGSVLESDEVKSSEASQHHGHITAPCISPAGAFTLPYFQRVYLAGEGSLLAGVSFFPSSSLSCLLLNLCT